MNTTQSQSPARAATAGGPGSLHPVCSTALERVVENLADGMIWNWTRMLSERDAADAALRLLANEGLIEQREHPWGGRIWRVNGKLFGRTDGITLKKFETLKR